MTAGCPSPRWTQVFSAELSAMADDAHAIDNAFGCELTFGTGGLRGILGAGTNRMNVHVVRRAAQAVADYLSGTALPKRAAIGYDSRIGSARFARELPPSLRQMVSKHTFTPPRAGARPELCGARTFLRRWRLHHRQP